MVLTEESVSNLVILLIILSVISLCINVGVVCHLANQVPVTVEVVSPQPVSNYDYIAPALFDEKE